MNGKTYEAFEPFGPARPTDVGTHMPAVVLRSSPTQAHLMPELPEGLEID